MKDYEYQQRVAAQNRKETAKGEFQTLAEAERMVRSLSKASAYCQGPNSSRQMNDRIRAVEAERDRLKRYGK